MMRPALLHDVVRGRLSSTRVDRKYPEVLNTLCLLLKIESDRRCVDNICAALCRMTTAHTDAMPISQVV